jgi:hypothetical protein
MIWSIITIILMSIMFIGLILYVLSSLLEQDILYKIGSFIIITVLLSFVLMLIVYLAISTFGIKI